MAVCTSACDIGGETTRPRERTIQGDNGDSGYSGYSEYSGVVDGELLYGEQEQDKDEECMGDVPAINFRYIPRTSHA